MKQINNTETRTFLNHFEDEAYHVMKTGYASEPEKEFMVIREDAYQVSVGKTDLVSRKKLKEKYNITWN